MSARTSLVIFASRTSVYRIAAGVIAVDRAEISLPVDQRIAHRKILRHADDRVVDRRVAVRMIFTDHVADDAGRFFIWLVERIAELEHRPKNAAVDGFEAVADVGQGRGR